MVLVIRLPEEVIDHILDYVDHVPTLIQMKSVSTTWRDKCQNCIDTMQTKVFESREELRMAVIRYTIRRLNRDNAHEFAITYGFPIGKWDVSKIDDFSYLFYDLETFNEDINDWDVSKATNMSCMFRDAKTFNRDLSRWNTSGVINMEEMFSDTSAFNQNISNWDTSNVTTMKYMFQRAYCFNQNQTIDLSRWNISSVTDMTGMFQGAIHFNQDPYNQEEEGPNWIVIVEGAGNPAVNGTYARDAPGFFECAYKFSRQGYYKGEVSLFSLFQCNISNNNNTKYWYISIVPANGRRPGTNNGDVDFYSVPVKEGCTTKMFPPLSGWTKSKEGLDPPPILVVKNRASGRN